MHEPEICGLYEQLLLTAFDRTKLDVDMLDVDTIAQLTCDEARLLSGLLPLEEPTAGILASLDSLRPGDEQDASTAGGGKRRCAALFALGPHAQLSRPLHLAGCIAELTRLGITRVRRSSWGRQAELLRSAELQAWLESLGEHACGVSFFPLVLEVTEYGAHLMRASLSAAADAERRIGRARRRGRLKLVDG